MVSRRPIQGEEYQSRLKGGVLADGLVSVIASAVGSLPLTTFAQNNGVIQMTGVASRYVGRTIAVMLVILGLFPMIGGFFTTIPSAVLGEAFAASEAENADSASSAATDAEAQQALEEATQNMQETFDELIALLDKESLLDGINCIDMENLQEITLSYQNRLVIKLGTGNNLPYKLQLTGVIVRNDDGNCLSDSDRGTLDVSYVKKDGTIEPVFRSENDIDITAAISADSQTQEGEENTEDADGTTAPTE